LPDYGQPGSDGDLPSGFEEWKWGVTYTVGPEATSRLTTAVRRKIARTDDFTGYGDLYRQTAVIADARIRQIACDAGRELPHTWILSHGWRRIDIGGANDLLIAFRTIGLVQAETGEAKPQGETEPGPAELMTPGGATDEMLTAQVAPQRVGEIYIEFDHRDPGCANHNIFMFSYGERLPSCEGINFEPFVERAEKRARFHSELLPGDSQEGDFRIIRREWMCATNPDIAVVHVYSATGWERGDDLA